MKPGLLVFAIFVVVVVSLLSAANATWQSRTSETVARLAAAGLEPPDSVFTPRMLEGLPAPAARYLRAVLRDGTPLVWHAVIRHDGRFRNDPAKADGWEFHSVQHYDVRPAGFVWDARMRMAPGVDMLVRDAFLSGEGSMLVRVAGLLPVIDEHDSSEIAAAALQRWLAETAWFPTALLPGQSVTWTAIDDSTARATATSGGTTASLDFHFGADSLLTDVRTDARARAVNGSTTRSPWRGAWSTWRWYGGMRIPMRGEAEWELPAGPFTYWRGSITEATYQ
jgi:hypothetical protein